METIYWGPSGWRFLHLITFLYPHNPDTEDKLIMCDFMSILPDILPCKYCRASFSKYSTSLKITPYLETRDLLIEWLYKMHNKVNKKLRAQGFCHHENPTLEHVHSLYKPQTEQIHKLMHINHNDCENSIEHVTNQAIQCICNEGREFLGSIIFNYQGYFANCHTSEEKSKITTTYHRFFNLIPVLIKMLLLNPDKDYKHKSTKSNNDTKGNNSFNIRKILQQNEPYSKLKKWFYECDELCDNKNKFKKYTDYEHEFEKHIVSSCNSPSADNIKSCRKVSSRKSKLSSTQTRNKKTKHKS
jgi:hypothetical protein